MPKSETFEEAFQELADAAYHGKLKPGSRQWGDLRKFFYAGALWFTEQCASREDIDDLMDEMHRFYDDIGSQVKTLKSINEDIERSGQ